MAGFWLIRALLTVAALGAGLLLYSVAPERYAVSAAGEWSDGRLTPFAVKFKGEVSPYPVIGLFAMPEDTVPLEVVFAGRADSFEVSGGDGALERLGPWRWRWLAPREPGLHRLRIARAPAGDTVRVNAFIMVPLDELPRRSDYRIGEYMRRPLRGDTLYRVPEGLIEVTLANRDVRVSPNFRIGQFTSKQTAAFPKYLVLRERLPLKLEMLLEQARLAGFDAGTFAVMSGYRTPWYHREIGNRTRYSRHLYGDAPTSTWTRTAAASWTISTATGGARWRMPGSWWTSSSGCGARPGTSRSSAASVCIVPRARTARSSTWMCGVSP